jgi:ABC-type nitrate/sulfonate/bicarbonate transport system substrate-binding protein
VTYGSTGPGSVQHLAAALFAKRAGIEMQHVPYRGSAPALADLMAGTIDVIFEGIIPASPFLQSAQIRPLALAVTTPAQVAAYNRDGYLAPLSIFSATEAAANRDFFDRLMATAARAQRTARAGSAVAPGTISGTGFGVRCFVKRSMKR